MSGANVLLATTCSVSGQWERHVGAVSALNHSSSRRAAAAWLSSSQWGSNCRVASCRSSRDRKSWNITGLALETLHKQRKHSIGGQRNDGREAGKTRALAVAVEEEKNLEHTKLELLNEVIETGRGLVTTAEQRAIIEEKLVAVEKFDAGTSLELDKLDGTWLLQYTTAPDVIQILQASETPFLKVGQIFQKFECKGLSDGGVVRNVVRWSIPGILQDVGGATFVVTAEFSVVSARSIALSFEEAQLGQVEISDGLQALLAPAVLPRTFLNLEFLQFFRNLNVRVPLVQSAARNNNTRSFTMTFLKTSQKATDAGSTMALSCSAPVGLWYYLTYLDRDMLVGRALGNGGIFIFSRTQQFQLF